MIKLNVSAANIAVEEKETLTEGRVGLLCRFSFTGEWDGLAKTAVFDGADSRDVILTEDTVAVPAECLADEGYSLSVGVYGKNAAGDIVIPTVYATVGKIQRSAWPSGKETAPPTPDVVAQIQQAAANAEAMARAVREDAELGKFKGEKGDKGDAGERGGTGPAGEPGGWYTPAVTQPDGSILRVSFSPSKEGMPTVPPKDITIPGGGSIAIDDTMTVSGAAADAKATGDALRKLSEEKVNKSGWAADKYLGTDDSGNVVEKEAPNGVSAGLPENLAYLQDVTVDEASGDFIPMLSPNGTEYRLSIGDDGIPIIKNISGTTVWTGTSGGTGGDSGGDSGGGDAAWTSGVAYTLVPIAGGYINAAGEVISDATWAYTDYMPCAGAARMTYRKNAYSSRSNAFYDINKTFISGFAMAATSAVSALEITVPESAAYFRISNNSEATISDLTIIPYES